MLKKHFKQIVKFESSNICLSKYVWFLFELTLTSVLNKLIIFLFVNNFIFSSASLLLFVYLFQSSELIGASLTVNLPQLEARWRITIGSSNGMSRVQWELSDSVPELFVIPCQLNSGEHGEVSIEILTFLSWWRHQMETFSALLALCAWNSPVTGEFPAKRPVTRSFDAFVDLRLNKRFSKKKKVRLVIWDAVALIMTSV